MVFCVYVHGTKYGHFSSLEARPVHHSWLENITGWVRQGWEGFCNLLDLIEINAPCNFLSEKSFIRQRAKRVASLEFSLG